MLLIIRCVPKSVTIYENNLHSSITIVHPQVKTEASDSGLNQLIPKLTSFVKSLSKPKPVEVVFGQPVWKMFVTNNLSLNTVFSHSTKTVLYGIVLYTVTVNHLPLD